MKHLKSILKSLSLLLLVVTLVACSRGSDNGEDSGINVDTSVGEYYIKATGSNDVTVNVVVVFADGATQTLQIGEKVPYTSPKYKAGNVSFSIGAEGTSENSTLVVELIKDGKVVKTSTSKGKYMSSGVSN